MNDASAKSKWIAIQVVRWTGLGMFFFGLLISADKVDLPNEMGYVLVILGLFETLFLPTLLARMWKTPK